MMNNCLDILDIISEKLLQDFLAAEDKLPGHSEKDIVPYLVFRICMNTYLRQSFSPSLHEH